VKITVSVSTVRPTTLPYTVASILKQTWTDWELLLIGQGDDPDLARVCGEQEMLDSRIHYIHLDQRGISRARNAGVRAATGDIVAMTDDDCEAAPDRLEKFATLFAKYPSAGLVGGALLAPHVSLWKLETCLSYVPAEALYDPASDRAAPEGFGWIGANFAVRKSVAEQIGPFDECLGAGAAYFPAAEDTDYMLRLIAAGIPMVSSPAPVVYHTYGARRGIRQNLNNSLAYARGNGALDAKLTLSGNPHGERSASRVMSTELMDAIRSRRPQRVPVALMYSVTYKAAYRQCLREFAIGPDGCLSQIGATAKDMVAR
jgi:GT2 family glycosyltransferase